MNDAQAIEFARLAMQSWNVQDTPPRLIKNRENAVFEVKLETGARAALRLHRPGYQSDASIRSELLWSAGLDAAGMTVPRPVKTRDGDMIANIPRAGRVASLVTWIDGVPLGEGQVEFDWDAPQQNTLYFALGKELAKLHRLSDALTFTSQFERPVLDIAGLLGEQPLWGRFWENPALNSDEKDLLLKARRKISDTLATLPTDGAYFGLIHADALRENVLVQGDDVCLIDFDDGVFGYRLYELGVAMSQNWHLPNAPDLAEALCRGYGLDPQLKALIPVFTVLRALASCGWVIPRYRTDDPAMKEYANRAVVISKRYVRNQPVYG